MSAVPAASGTQLITCVYNDRATAEGVETGLAWAILHDNAILAWVIDESGAKPAAPVILGTMVTSGPDTGDVKSPPWAQRSAGQVYIPDMARGSTNEFFNFIAYNNGAHRQIYAEFADGNLATEFNQWSSANPGMMLSTPPNLGDW